MPSPSTIEHLTPSSRLSRRALTAVAAATAFVARYGRTVTAEESTPVASPATSGETVYINGVNLFYEEQGSGPPLLLIPGLAAPGAFFASLIPALAPRFRLIAIDNRGAGRSAVSSGPYTTRILADDAAALLAHLGIDCAHVLGFSLGALIAQEMALVHSESVDHLVLLGAAARPNPAVFDPWLDVFVQAYERQLDLDGFSLWVMAWLFSPTFMGQPDVVAATMPALAGALGGASAAGVTAQAAAARNHDTFDRLGQIAAPTLILVGEEDIVFPVVYAQALADGIPGARLQILPNGAHAVSLENPKATAGALLDFLPA